MLLSYSDSISHSLWLFVTFFGAVVLALLTGVAFHEASHAFTADHLGDHTARFMGRCTLNPLAHLDPTGTVFMLLAGFGWGKPTPVNPGMLRYGPQRGRAIVAAAGPVSNLFLAVLASIPINLGLVPWQSPFSFIPLSISHWGLNQYLGLILSDAVIFNIILAVFNLLPVAPLDGFSVAVGVLPRQMGLKLASWEQYGPGVLMLLLVLPYLTGYSLLGNVMSPIIDAFLRIFVGGGRVF